MRTAPEPTLLPPTPALAAAWPPTALPAELLRPARHLPAGACLVEDGTTGPLVVVVEAGVCVVTTSTPDGATAVVDVLGPGEASGTGLFPAGFPARTGTPGDGPWHLVRAVVASRVTVMTGQDLWGAAEPSPTRAAWLTRLVADGLRRSQARLVDALVLPVRERVLAALADLAERFGGLPGTDGKVAIPMPVTQDLLAGLVGATRESVNRAVRSLTDLEAVEHSGRRYRVLVEPSTGPNRPDGSLTTAPRASSSSRWASTDLAAAGYRSVG
jgi:CRP-like cAMP-binding protein